MDKPRQTRISKFLSLVLRHQPEKIGLGLDDAGWALVADLISGCRREGVSFTEGELKIVVQENDKKRFEFSTDGMKIRASQGHSIEVELEYEPLAPPETLYHGTADRFLASIRKSGLLKQSRHHVHLSADRDPAIKVGTRHGRPVVLLVAAGRMHAAGQAFFRSTNGVWLTEHVPPEFLSEE
jgi:putative RNA 2'-phosphotransferase